MRSSAGESPLRLVFPFNQLEIGGAELRALRLVERLPRDRFQAEFVSTSGAGAMDQRARDVGARIHYTGSRPIASAPLPLRAAGRLGKLVRYTALARARRFDIVNAWLYPADVVAVLGRRATANPLIVAGRFNQHPRRAFGPLSERVDAYVNSRVDAIVANSNVVAASARGEAGVDPQQVHVIYNGVEPSEPQDRDARRLVRSALGVDDEDVLIGSIGNLREVKRQELLIDAFADLAASRPHAKLAIIGEGPMRASLERQIDNLGLRARVRLPGARDDVGPLLAAFDVLALSSRSEGLPNALLEGAAAGRPIVTTAAGGAVEAVVHDVTGLVVPVEDRFALARALAALVDDPRLRRAFGSDARQYAGERFGMDRFVREWVELYEMLALDRRRG